MRWRWAAAGSLSAIALIGWFAVCRQRPAPPALLLVGGPAEAWRGIDPQQRAGILALIQDALETGYDRTVLTESPCAPKAAGSLEVAEVTVLREGDDLRIRCLRTHPNGHRASFEHRDTPARALGSLLKFLDQPRAPLRVLLPSSPPDFWSLAGVLEPGAKRQIPMQILEARALAARQPGCAPAHFALAYLSFRQINAELPAGPEPQAACEAEFRTALRLLPSYPRAAYQLARLKVDTGSAREALEISFRFRKEHPRNVAAFGGLAYAARNSGLLEGAATALRLRENLCGGGLADPGLAENTYLYRGELERFQQTLGEGPLESQEPVRAFYRGYLRLLQGDPAGAKAFFHHASLRHGVDSQFERLAGIYDLALQGRQREALAELDELRIHRASLRVPDGEFTFKLAEAYAFLGQREAAVDTASRAFGQGFGCTQWYRESPLLRELQELPRWRNLLQHLQERQDLIALAFPPERFLHP